MHRFSILSLQFSLSSFVLFFYCPPLRVIGSVRPPLFDYIILPLHRRYRDLRTLLAVAYRTRRKCHCWMNVHQGFKFKDDNTLLRHINDTNRSIYAFELTEPPDAYTSVPDGGGDRVMDADTCQKCTVTGEEISCTICLEELDGDLKRHSGNGCNFGMCDPCIEVSLLSLIL